MYGSETFSRLAGRDVWLKAENLQRTGAFKVRGAVNRIATLSDAEREAGVVAASAGNHGQAVAWAAREAGIPATDLHAAGRADGEGRGCRTYGAELILDGEGFEDALAAARGRRRGARRDLRAPVRGSAGHRRPGDDRARAGRAGAGAETVVMPVGGGGLASGIALALRELRPRSPRSSASRPACPGFTIADGIFVKQPGELTVAILDDVLDDLVDVDDEEISEAIVLLLERAKLVVEGAGAVGVAALLGGKVGGSGPVALLSGGNIDPTLLISVMRHGLTVCGRYLVVRTRDPRPARRAGEAARRSSPRSA